MNANAPAVVAEKPRELVAAVEAKLVKMIGSGELQIPKNYSAENAMKVAYLILQRTTTKTKEPVLKACTPASISNSLMDMVTQALDPNKKQGYFIAYGNQLSFQRSYFGSMALAERANPNIARFASEVVYADDELEYEIRNGEKRVLQHKQKLGNIDKTKIIAAYAMALDRKGNVITSVLLTWDEIMASWGQSKAYPIDDKGRLKPDSTHAKHTAEMAKRTAINRVCKYIINASDDSHLYREVVARTDEDGPDMNGELLDIEEGGFEIIDGEPADTTTGEIPEQAAPTEEAEPKPEPKPVQKPGAKAPF
jgi:recombination protein RecT